MAPSAVVSQPPAPASAVPPASAGKRHMANAESSTYRYRDADQRRAYMRQFMRAYRARKAQERRQQAAGNRESVRPRPVTEAL